VRAGGVKAYCHITGGGLPGNLPRVLPDGVAIQLDERRWQRSAIFDLIAKRGDVAIDEMRMTFNLGLGFVAVVEAARADELLALFQRAGERASIVGSIIALAPSSEPVQFV
jgi:phosphoribosylformylglycinamidine cyclo-ligase